MKKIEIEINTQEIILNHKLGCNNVNAIYFNKLKTTFETKLNDIFHDAIMEAKNPNAHIEIK